MSARIKERSTHQRINHSLPSPPTVTLPVCVWVKVRVYVNIINVCVCVLTKVYLDGLGKTVQLCRGKKRLLSFYILD
jgi:hypothetical protein